ncbi:DMT family transporter [Allopontixanthobacter sp.]|uniref:DMT family transporter n=1 Tax=Allopontixanthobacter sp. TaxID=2906452 RepID=UPI002AB813C4|nr:DMT family transporter [Allopontixanthobacter sp.]MDZ4308420.1 DMT family transporter [Allopontixanthobacter sp.]
MSARSFFLLTFVCILWALNVVVSRLVVDGLGVPPLWFAALRSLVVVLVLARYLRPVPSRWPWVALITFMISGGSFGLLFVGLRDATPSAAAVVSLSGAPLTVVFAILILKEKVRWRRGIGIALSFLGVAVAIASPSGWSSSVGLIFVGASAIVGALGSVWLKTIELPPLRLQAWAGLVSAIVLLPLSALTESGQAASVAAGGWRFAAGLAFSALVVSVFAHTVYFRLLRDHDANLIAPLTLMTPIFTIVAGAAITGDEVGLQLLVGALIAVSGVMVILVRPSRELFKPLLVRTRI